MSITNKCKVEGCDRQFYGLGYCELHWRRLKKHGDIFENIPPRPHVNHGMTGTAEHRAWISMRRRCYLKTFRQYKDYGGRGIRVCDEWLSNFMAFYNYIGPKPSPQHTLDRINNNGNYEPGNVRWATWAEQATNKSPRGSRKYLRVNPS